jgi:hypothetical protein
MDSKQVLSLREMPVAASIRESRMSGPRSDEMLSASVNQIAITIFTLLIVSCGIGLDG